jgi:MYXO-CTERM domain-containing protein
MLFSLARGGYAPPALGQLRADGAPHIAVVASGACILVATTLARVTPRAYAYLQGVALFGAITVWIIILASHLSFRRMHRRADLPVKTPLFPAIQCVSLGLLIAILLSMGLDPDWNTSLMVGLPWLGLLSVAYVFWRRRRRSEVEMSLLENVSAHD